MSFFRIFLLGFFSLAGSKLKSEVQNKINGLHYNRPVNCIGEICEIPFERLASKEYILLDSKTLVFPVLGPKMDWIDFEKFKIDGKSFAKKIFSKEGVGLFEFFTGFFMDKQNKKLLKQKALVRTALDTASFLLPSYYDNGRTYLTEFEDELYHVNFPTPGFEEDFLRNSLNAYSRIYSSELNSLLQESKATVAKPVIPKETTARRVLDKTLLTAAGFSEIVISNYAAYAIGSAFPDYILPKLVKREGYLGDFLRLPLFFIEYSAYGLGLNFLERAFISPLKSKVYEAYRKVISKYSKEELAPPSKGEILGIANVDGVFRYITQKK